MKKVVWRVSQDIHTRIEHLTAQLQTHSITEEEWCDRVMSLPGYPLRGRPEPGTDLVIQVIQPVTSQVPKGMN